MSRFSKIVILIILVLSFFFIKEKTGFNFEKLKNPFKGFSGIETLTKKAEEEIVKAPSEIIKTGEEKAIDASVYFLALDSNGNSIYKKVKREAPYGTDKLNFAVQELLKGPDLIEKTAGAYSEIPKNTKLLGIRTSNNKVIIDLSSDFQNGGGTDSIYSRMMQLIKTSIENADNKKVYLYLDGKQIKFIGGEGIMVTQPLNEKSLEI